MGSDSLMLQKEWQISVTGSVKARMIYSVPGSEKHQVQFVSSLMDLQRGLGRLAIRRKHTLRIQPFQWLAHNIYAGKQSVLVRISRRFDSFLMCDPLNPAPLDS